MTGTSLFSTSPSKRGRRDRRDELDRILGHGLVGPLAGEHLREPCRARPAGSPSRPDAPSGTRGTSSGCRPSRSTRARSRVRCTGMSGSWVPCSRSTGTSTARGSNAEGSPSTNAGLIASTPAGRGRSLASSAEPEREAGALREAREDRRLAREAERLALLVDQRVELGERLRRAAGSRRRRTRTRRSPGVPGTAIGARGSTVAKTPSGSRYGSSPPRSRSSAP